MQSRWGGALLNKNQCSFKTFQKFIKYVGFATENIFFTKSLIIFIWWSKYAFKFALLNTLQEDLCVMLLCHWDI